jgi:hypothetical protein
MSVQIFDRSNPDRNRTSSKWFLQLRDDMMSLVPGNPGMPLKKADQRLAAGVHEVKLPERGIAQLCKNCRKGTRDSLWMTRCGPCGEFFSPLLTIFNSCDACGGPAEALEQLAEHLERSHPSGQPGPGSR